MSKSKGTTMKNTKKYVDRFADLKRDNKHLRQELTAAERLAWAYQTQLDKKVNTMWKVQQKLNLLCIEHGQLRRKYRSLLASINQTRRNTNPTVQNTCTEQEWLDS